MTLYEGLQAFQDLYLDLLATGERRTSDPIDTLWQKINNEWDLYYLALSEGDSTSAADHIQNIIDILAGEDIIVDVPPGIPLPLSFTNTPSNFLVSVYYDGTAKPTSFDNTISTITVYNGSQDDTVNWTFTVDSVTDVTAIIQNDNEVKLTGISADSGSLTVRGQRANYTDIIIYIPAYKVYDPTDGVVVLSTPGNIVVPTDYDGTSPDYTNALSVFTVRFGELDDTINWAFAVQSSVDVTAVIQNDNELKVNAIAADVGSVVVRASRSGFNDYDVTVNVYKSKKGNPGTGFIDDGSGNIYFNVPGKTVAIGKTPSGVGFQVQNPGTVGVFELLNNAGTKSLFVVHENSYTRLDDRLFVNAPADTVNSCLVKGLTSDDTENTIRAIDSSDAELLNVRNDGLVTVPGDLEVTTSLRAGTDTDNPNFKIYKLTTTWNMDTTTNILVSYPSGVDQDDIIGIEINILLPGNQLSNLFFKGTSSLFTSIDGGHNCINSGISLWRINGGAYDIAGYSAATVIVRLMVEI